MAMSSTIQILKVNEIESGVSAKTQKPWERHTAECIVLTDDGQVECVGRFVVPPALREGLRTGVFRAAFSLRVPTFGDNKGDIVPQLTGLVPVPPLRAPGASPSAAPVVKAPV